MASLALAIAGIASAAGGIADSAIGANAASTASGQQQQEINQAINVNQPYLNEGQTGLTNLTNLLQNGTFGTPSTFTAPTLSQAEQTPGFQFVQEQGDKGILEGSAAGGGAISGGTLQALSQYNTGLADTTYNQIFQQALQGYTANLAGNQQAFQQTLAPVEIGQQGATSISQLLQALGNSKAAGTVGSANAIEGGIGNATNGISQALLMNSLIGSGTNSSGNLGTSLSSLATGAGSNLNILNPSTLALPTAGAAPINYGVGPG
jgi:hypothetical protein